MDKYIEALRRYLQGAANVVTTAPKGASVVNQGVSNLAQTQGLMNQAAGSAPGLSPTGQRLYSLGSLPSTNLTSSGREQRFDEIMRKFGMR